jgi:hypothetical protein
VKGSSRSIGWRAAVLAIFVVAFLTGALAIFSAAGFAGEALRVDRLSFAWRAGSAAAVLVALACLDFFSVKKDRYCPLGLRRQTPRSLLYRHPAPTVAAVWGFDTGLAVTTIRVAALTWGALALAVLGVSSWWAGFGYGIGFLVPVVASILAQPPREQPTPGPSLGLRLQGQLATRGQAQLASAVLMLAAAAVLLALGGATP